LTWQEERTLTANLVVHYKRVSYLVRSGIPRVPFVVHKPKRSDPLVPDGLSPYYLSIATQIVARLATHSSRELFVRARIQFNCRTAESNLEGG